MFGNRKFNKLLKLCQAYTIPILAYSYVNGILMAEIYSFAKLFSPTTFNSAIHRTLTLQPFSLYAWYVIYAVVLLFISYVFALNSLFSGRILST